MVRIGRGSIALFFAVCLPSAAQAACSQWDVSGTWTAIQSNMDRNPYKGADVRVEQTGTVLRGDASYRNQYETIGGSLDGTIIGDTFQVTIYWRTNSEGHYSGTVGPQGRIKGVTFDARNPWGNKADWYSSRTEHNDSTSPRSRSG